MKRDEITITQLLTTPPDYSIINDLWFDWFCKDKALVNKGVNLLKKLKAISKSSKFDNDKCYVFFKNGLTGAGKLYDEFKICDIETGDVIYDVMPTGWGNDGYPEVWGIDNDFEEPIIKVNSWKELKAWFLK
jgi:hypothetical protein